MRTKNRTDKRRKTVFHDDCTDNSCIMWIVAVFRGVPPAYIRKNLPKKWIKSINDLNGYIDEDILSQIAGELGDSKATVIICEYEFSWVDDPQKHFQDQIYGQNIASWLLKNDNHKSLIYGYSWNKID